MLSSARVVLSKTARDLSVRSLTTVFPNEQNGNNYGTNWAIASLGVSVGSKPLGAHRNPNSETLLNSSKEKEEENISSKNKNKETKFFSTELCIDTFADVANAAKQAASSAGEDLYLVDANAGRSSRSSVNVRCVSDSSKVTSLLQSILPKAPFKPAERFFPNVLLVHSKTPDADFENTPYVAVRGSQIVLRGDVDQNAVKEAIYSATANAMDTHGALALRGNVVLNDKTGETSLVLGKTAAKKGSKVVIESALVWSEQGLSSLLENNSKLANVLPHPKTIEFEQAAKEGEEIKSVSFIGGTEAEQQLFQKLVKVSGAKLT